MKKDFSEAGSATKFKIQLIQDYFENGFAPLIMQYGKICIIDPFCGCGIYEDGTEGSPIIILKVLRKYLMDPKTKQIIFDKHKYRGGIIVDVTFGDSDENNLNQLKNIVESNDELNFFETEYGKKDFISYFSGDYLKCLESKKAIIDDTNIPKFIFLDPFNFAVTRDLVDELVNKKTDLALFIPFNHIHRLKKSKNIPKVFQDFIDGFAGGEERNTIEEGIECIKNNLNENIKYVRVIHLDSGEKSNNKYLIIFFTNNLNALHIMNKVIYNKDYRGQGFNQQIEDQVKQSKYGLFGEFSHQDLCAQNHDVQFMLDELKTILCENEMTNVSIIEYVEKKGIPIINDIRKKIENLIKELIEKNKIEEKRQLTAQRGYYLGFDNYNHDVQVAFIPKLK